MTACCAVASSAAKTCAIHVTRLEEMRGFRRDRSIELSQGGEIVEDPERSSVRRRDEIAFLHSEIVNGNDRKIAAKTLPRSSIVEADPHSFFRSCVQQSAANRIFTHDARELVLRNSIRDELPGSAVIGGLIDVRLE